jgi:formylglycine-generating enzyme required for sulfatase activity
VKRTPLTLIGVLTLLLAALLLPHAAGRAQTGGGLNQANDLYLPLVTSSGEVATPTIDGVPIRVGARFLPGEFISSQPEDANQITTAFLLNPFREFSIISVPYGPAPPIENLPDAAPGGADVYRSALADYRIQQGGTPQPGPTVSLFDQEITGSYSIVDLVIDSDTPQSTLIVEWVVEAESRLWIIRITRDLSDGTDLASFLDSLQGLVVEVDNTIVQQPSGSSALSSENRSQSSHSLQSPTALPSPSWWSGECNVNNHAGSYPLGAAFDGLVACGPLGTTRLVYFFDGARGQYEWQCTELAKRYLYLKHDIDPYQAHGKDVVNNMPQQYVGTLFERISNGTPNEAPESDDVISFGAATTYGHVAIVTAANVDANGNGSIEIIEQNWSQTGHRSLPVTNWRVGGSSSVTNWLHEKNAPAPDETVFVPAGEFQMGCHPDHNGGFDCYSHSHELPLHAVYLDAYTIDKYEVTNDQYAAFLNGRAGNDCGGYECVDLDSPYAHITYQGGQYVVESGYGDHPVIEVSWYGADSYCTENGGRLPTEAEWEKAARETTVRAYPWGDQYPDCTLANYYLGSGNYCVGDTTPVGSYPVGASPYGAMDMAGNVYEWVNDWYDGDYYSNSPYSNPPGPDTGTYKVLRGGSWLSLDYSVRAADRNFNDPTDRDNLVGFRCAQE